MRLCFPQILKQILGGFHMEQICLACEELLIHVAPATNQQLSALKGKSRNLFRFSKSGARSIFCNLSDFTSELFLFFNRFLSFGKFSLFTFRPIS